MKCTSYGYLHEGNHPPDTCPRCGASMYQFMLYEPLDSELEQHLVMAFAGKSQAYVRNLAYARRAVEEGLPAVARLFKAVAEAEKVHVDEYLKYLEGVVGSSEDNLRRAFDNELEANQDSTSGWSRRPSAWVARTWPRASSAPATWKSATPGYIKEALSALANDRDLDYHVCTVCGYVFDGEPPDECPVCRSPRDKFKAII